MALTIGTGPFSERPAGRFDVAPPLTPLLFWEPYLKRFRIIHGGKTVADTHKALALHQTGQMVRICVPMSDVQRQLLVSEEDSNELLTGLSRSWSLNAGKTLVEAAAQSFEAPPQNAASLQDHICFDLEKVDAWYLEDDLGYAHPRDPYHRFDVHRSSRHVAVLAGETVIAETTTPAFLFETGMAPRIYLPPDAVRSGFLRKSDTVSQCPYKGDGQHWHIEVDCQTVADAAWNLTTPMGDALIIPRWFSFYPEKVNITVDGHVFQPTG